MESGDTFTLEAPLEPVRDARASLGQPRGHRIAVELRQFATQRLDDECRWRVFGLANGHGDVRQRRRRRDAALEPRQTFEWVRGE
jgi:hypothetical protein